MRRRSHSELFLNEEMDGQERVKKKRRGGKCLWKERDETKWKKATAYKNDCSTGNVTKELLSRGINLHISCKPPPFIPT